MKIDDGLMRQLVSDLGLNVRFERGSTIPVKNCWHFMTDGDAVAELFRNDDDFRYGMNLLFLLTYNSEVIVLAFTLMDTHVHFILYGDVDKCSQMVHEYVRRLMMYLAHVHNVHGLLAKDPVQYQAIEDDVYLKTAICYVIKNAPTGGLPYNAWDYPWSSGPLYFRHTGHWNAMTQTLPTGEAINTLQTNIQLFHSKLEDASLKNIINNLHLIDNIVHPDEYVAWEVVEALFKSPKGFNYFLCRTKSSDVDDKGGTISYLTIPMQEMRQHKKELCLEMFGTEAITGLDTGQRLKLAKALRARYNSSKKQIARLCGLIYSEVEEKL